ncbi:MAG: serine--tRNA ligase [Gammaproteobacteria bacterium]
MIDLKLLKNNLKDIEKKINSRGENFDLSNIVLDYEKKNSLQIEIEDLRNQKKKISKEIGELKKIKSNSSEQEKRSDELSTDLFKLEKSFEEVDKKIDENLSLIPNIPHEKCPNGNSEEDNVEVHRKEYKNPETSLDHVEIGEKIDSINFDDATKVAGPRFVVLKNKLAQMHRALIQFMLDEAIKNNYQERYVPHIVNSNSLFGTGQLPKFAKDSFKVENEEKYLIPTAEVPLTNLFRDKQLTLNELPVMVTAHTPCYRSEAGSYGKDTRGMIRQHQFEKVELVQIVHPSNSNNALNSLISHASSILDMLEISYRHVELCTGDLGFSASKTIDIEVWLPSQETFREISSCSNFTDFQARRMSIKIKDEKEKILAHTINGSGLAVGRCLVAIMENYFDENKGLIVPEALKKYVNFEFIPLK